MRQNWIFEKILKEDINNLGKKIIEKDVFYIMCHVRPDPDMLGSALSMYEILIFLGKDVKIYNIEKDNESLGFMPFNTKFELLNENTVEGFKENSLVMLFDTSDPYDKYFKNWRKAFEMKDIQVCNIDHHSDNERYADINIVYENCPSCTMLMSAIYEYWNIVWTPSIATNLLAGLLADTGNLMHDNTNADAFRTISFLISKGGDMKICTKNLFKKYSFERLRLWGRIMKRLKWTENNAVYSYAKISDLVETNTNDEDLSGDIINRYMAGIKNSKYAVFIKEKSLDSVKVSLRTLDDNINVQDIAKQFNGGGHPKASGFLLSNISIEKGIPLLKEKL